MSTRDRSIDELIRTLLIPRAGPGYDQLRGEALAELLARGDEAHARLVELASDPDPPVQVLEVLPRFGRAAAVAPLHRALLHAPDPTTVTAAHALARHPDPAAHAALLDAIGSPRAQSVASAAAALGAAGDLGAAAPLRRALDTAPEEALPALRRALEQLSG